MIRGLIGVLGALGLTASLLVWQALHRPLPLAFGVRETGWDRWVRRLDARVRRSWRPQTQRQAQILQMPPWHVVGLAVLAAGVGGVLGGDLFSPVPWLGALGGMVLGVWQGPRWVVGSRFRQRQRALTRDFPPLVLLLRIYLDLGVPLPEAVAACRPAVARLTRQELDRLLAQFQLGARAAALRAWAQRTDLALYAILADTLAQGWDDGLSGAALQPLDTLMDAAQDQGTRSLTDRLDGMATLLVPLTALGWVLVGFSAIVLHVHLGGL